MARWKNRSISTVLPSLVLAALVLSSCASGLRGGPILLHPVPPREEPYALSQGALVFARPGLRVTARPVDWRVAEKDYGRKAGDLSNFIFFSLRFENFTNQSIFFNPLRTKIYTQKRKFSLALDISDIYIMNRKDPGLEEKAKRFRTISYDGSVTVGPGKSDERYLVFPVPTGKLKTIELTLDDLFVGSESFDMTFLFEAFPVEEKPSRP